MLSTVRRERSAEDRLLNVATLDDRAEAGFRASSRSPSSGLRFDRAGLQYIRLSPHFYNSLEEIARVVEILLEALGK